MLNILTIIGSRPQFIKAAPVSSALRNAGINEIIVNTGQHYDFNMSDIFINELNISKPDYNLSVGSSSHAKQTSDIIYKVEEIILTVKPHAVLVYGDTNSTLGGAIAVSKLDIPLIHIEAGLRSFNKAMPEEINRVITDHISTILFCPSNISKNNLNQEGIEKNVFVVGDVMYDIFKKWESKFNYKNKYGDYVLLTMHRAENTMPDILRKRLAQLSELALKIIFPIHPRTKKVLAQNEITIPKNMQIIEPMGWLELMGIGRNARFIITDSGGLQKEALWLKKHCLTIREQTEWVETIQQHVNQLVKVDDNISIPALRKGDFSNPYGDGDASEKITDIIKTI